jgi:hypothetical protein
MASRKALASAFESNVGADRVLALDGRGQVVFDSGRINGLDAGGSIFGPDGRYYLGLRRRRTILALPPGLDKEGEAVLPDGVVPFLEASASEQRVTSIWPQALRPPAKAITRSLCSTATECCKPPLVDDPEFESSRSCPSSEWEYRGQQRMALWRRACDRQHPRIRPLHWAVGPSSWRLTRLRGSRSRADCGSVRAGVVSIASVVITLLPSISVRARILASWRNPEAQRPGSCPLEQGEIYFRFLDVRDLAGV